MFPKGLQRRHLPYFLSLCPQLVLQWQGNGLTHVFVLMVCAFLELLLCLLLVPPHGALSVQ